MLQVFQRREELLALDRSLPDCRTSVYWITTLDVVVVVVMDRIEILKISARQTGDGQTICVGILLVPTGGPACKLPVQKQKSLKSKKERKDVDNGGSKRRALATATQQ